MINKTADAYAEAAQLSPTTSAAAYHSRFLYKLVQSDQRRIQAEHEKYQQQESSAYRGVPG